MCIPCTHGGVIDQTPNTRILPEIAVIEICPTAPIMTVLLLAGAGLESGPAARIHADGYRDGVHRQ